MRFFILFLLFTSILWNDESNFSKFLQEVKVSNVLQFGVDADTELLLNKCDLVTSIDHIDPEKHLKEFPNWNFIKNKNPDLFNPLYFLHLKKVCDDLFATSCFDCVIINPKIQVQKELLTVLFDRVPIILTSLIQDDAWDLQSLRNNYVRIDILDGSNISFWIRRDQIPILNLFDFSSSKLEETQGFPLKLPKRKPAHNGDFEKLFNSLSFSNVVQFGMGEETKFLLDRCSFVTTIDFLHSRPSCQKIRALFGEHANWKAHFLAESPSIKRAEYLVQMGQDPSLFDASYIMTIKSICRDLFANESYELAVVNQPSYLQEVIIHELFDLVPIIVAPKRKIATPSNYMQIDFSNLTLWVKKDETYYLENLGLDSPPSVQGLRVFFPDMHGSVLKSFAEALRYLGHTLVVPGRSFCGDITYGELFSKDPSKWPDYLYGDNVEVIEKDEFYQFPPDIFFINADDLEQELLIIWEKLNSSETKLAYFSGNDFVHYNKAYVRNLLYVDATTHKLFDQINACPWVPWIDFEELSFEGISDNLVINSYLQSQYEIDLLCPARKLFEQYTTGLSTIRMQPRMRPEMVKASMHESCATLHIKNLEGFGYTILESLSRGRPVFLKRSFSEGKRLMNWCIEGESAIFFDTYEEFLDKINKFYTDKNYRNYMQKRSAKLIREFINNEKQARILDGFLQNLK